MSIFQTDQTIRYTEAFLRRAARLDAPFMLKGSFVTRQYCADPTDRRPQDLDWLCLAPQPSIDEAHRYFSEWVDRIVAQDLGDGVQFEPFTERRYWTRLDYSMHEDFPTVGATIWGLVGGDEDGEGEDIDLQIDVSFNLAMPTPSIPLRYSPAQGEPFVVPHTPPLGLQVAWKMHQSMVRLRFKDLFDLLILLRHPSFDADARDLALRSLAAECQADGTDPARARYLLTGHLDPLGIPGATMFADRIDPATGQKTEERTLIQLAQPAADEWRLWRRGNSWMSTYWTDDEGRRIYPRFARSGTGGSTKGQITPLPLPDTLPEFEQLLRDAFAAAGFGPAGS